MTAMRAKVADSSQEQTQPHDVFTVPVWGQVTRLSSVMPLLRYFACVGGVLLVLLFVVNWSLPPLAAEPERAGADRSTIRIHSQHKWPSAVVFDTTLPTIVPPQAPAIAVASGVTVASGVAAVSATKPVREAFALAIETPAARPAEAVKAAKPRARRARAARAQAHPGHEPFGFRSMWMAGR